MGITLPSRFQPIHFFRRDRSSATFLATDHRLGRNEVVVKILGRRPASRDAEAIHALSWYQGLRHSLISEVLDAGVSRTGDLYYVRPHLAGSEFFSAPSMNRMKSLLSAVDFLYSKGRTHGSLKPANIFTAGEEVRLADPWLGLTSPSETKSMTEEDVRFTAPEVLAGGPMTSESDLYSLGAVLYRFYSGRDPFEDSDLEFLQAKYIWASPRPLSSVSHVSRDIGDMVTSLLHRDPTRRQAAFESLKREFDVRETSAVRAPAIGMSLHIEETLRVVLQKGSLRVILLAAPEGLGKSRFVAEIKQHVSLMDQPVTVCELKGQQVAGGLAEGIVAIANEQKLATKSTSLPRVRDWLANAAENQDLLRDEAGLRDLISLLAAVAQKTRLLLLIEDLDRSNKTAAKLLESIVQQPIDLDLAILVTARPNGIPTKTLNVLSKYVGPNLHQTAIEPLSPDDSEKLVSFFTRDQKRVALAQERAAGNPSFLEAYSRQASAAISPKSVRSALSGMILKLPDHARSVAEVLSVLGRSVEWSVLANVTGMPETDLKEAVASLRRIGLTNGEPPTIQYPDARMLLENRLSRSRRTDLHATVYRCLRDQGSDDTILAEHAFHGGLYEEAANLYRQLARDSFEGKNRGGAATYYGKVLECCLKDPNVQPLEGWDTVKFAMGQSHTGKEISARRMLQQLLQSEAVHKDSELLSTVYVALASPLLEESVGKRIALIKQAVNCLPERSSLFVRRHRLLVWTFLAVGDVEEAEKILKDCERRGTSAEELQELEVARACIFMSQGRFKSAVDCFLSQEFKWVTPGSVSNNLSVCIDLLGDLKRAREFQMSAYRDAVASKLFFGEVMSLSNLGSMESKMGNMSEAEKYFSLALSKLRDRDQEAPTSLSFGITYADAAAHFLHRGDFRAARQCMEQIDFDQSSFTSMETLSILHTQYYLEAALGQRESALEILDRARQVPLRGEFFEIERLMAESRISKPTRELSDRLAQSVRIAQRLETLYQECQVLLALARVLLSLENIQEANQAARRARRLSAAHGYRLLEAEALLLIGRSSQGKVKKEFFLSRSLDESSRLGLAPLAAECAFRMGSWRLNIGEFATAAEYLAKSVSITTRLAEQLKGSNRKAYLDTADHRAARELLDTASRGATIPVAELPGGVHKEDSFFAKLYRLGATMSASTSIESATSCLLEALKRSVDYPVTVVFGLGESTSFHSLRSNITEQTKQRILNTAERSSNKTYISGSGTQQMKKTTVWVPLLSLTQPGGIYMECPGGQIAPEERQIEFLTLVGAIAGAVFDRVAAKGNGVPIPSSAVSHGIIGTSKRVSEIHEQVEIAATNDANVLIEGESGTGKELVARAIHAQSARAKAPFVPVDCGALPEALIEAELFGAKRGSYTGSLSDRVGLFEAAHTGTIFLDEISNLGLAAQAKLLRVLQDREVRKIGSTSAKFVNVRLIAATNCNLERLVQQEKFRKDLLYRLKVLYFLIPPLRERKDDIPVLATTFLARLNTANQTQKYFGPAVMPKLTASDYPGNVRELQNAVERAFYSTRGGVITQISLLEESSGSPASYDAENWFRDLTEGRQDFWRAVHDPYKRRDIPRERVVALVDYGLRTTRGNYKAMASKLQIPKDEYRRFMDFLRRSKCLLDFRPYRRMAEPPE